MLESGQHFDINEWFLLVVTGLEIVAFFIVPTRFSLLTKVVVLGFNFCLSQAVDFVIAVKPLDLYDVNDTPGYEWFDLILYVITYPVEVYFAMYVYDRLQPRGWQRVGFVWGMAFVTLGFEAIAIWFGVYRYKGWNLYYSLLVYAVVYWWNIRLFDYVRSPRSSGQLIRKPIRRAD